MSDDGLAGPTGTTSFDFSGRRVLVTGGTSGIGRGIADAFGTSGAAVTVTGTRERASDYDADLSAFDYRRLRLTDEADGGVVIDELGGLDVLVNNAGSNLPGGRSEYEPDAFAESVAVNLLGPFRVSTAARGLLAASTMPGGGAVINIASMASYFAVPLVPGYAAAKTGLLSVTRQLALEWAGDGIRVNAVAPGFIATGMTEVMQQIGELSEPVLERTPLGRWGEPTDVAPAVLFLASSGARFITGQTIAVDGGYSIS